MMGENAFRKYLKQAGKKEHVIEGLVHQVRLFETFLTSSGQMGLEQAGEKELKKYSASLDPNRVKIHVRGVGLYFRFAGNAAMAKLAMELREERTAKNRRSFHIRDFRGVNPADAEKLEAVGVTTSADMLEAGKTPHLRARLAELAGVSPGVILELVKLSDISRLGAIKEVRARLYYDAGLDTPDKFSHWEPHALRGMLVNWVEETGFDGIAPLPKEIQNAIESARKLPALVDYEE